MGIDCPLDEHLKRRWEAFMYLFYLLYTLDTWMLFLQIR